MLKKYKNTLFEEIENASFNPKDFEGKEIEQEPFGEDRISEKKIKKKSILSFFQDTPQHTYKTKQIATFVVTLKNSDLFFSIQGGEHITDNFSTKKFVYSKYINNIINEDISFSDLIKNFRDWLRFEVKFFIEERDLPDLWVEAESYNSILDDVKITEESTSNFSEDEKTEVRNSINKFKLLVEENFKPNKEESEFINTRLNYLSEAVERLNRFDWHGLAVSTLMSIAVNLTVDTEKGKLLFGLFQQAFHSVTKLLT